MKKNIDKFISVTVAIIVLFALALTAVIFINNSNIAEIVCGNSQIEDLFGGYLGSILSTITVFLVYITFLYQKRELKEQREGFELTRSFDLIYKEFDILDKACVEYVKNVKLNNRTKHYQKRIEILKEIESNHENNFTMEYKKLINDILPFANKVSSVFGMFNFLASQPSSSKVIYPVIYKKIDYELIMFFSTIITMVDLVDTNSKYVKDYEKQEMITLEIILNEVLGFYFTLPPQHLSH